MLRRFLTLIGVALFLLALCIGVQGLFDLLHIPLILTSPKGPGQVFFYLLMVAGLWSFVRYVWNPHGLPSAWRAYNDPANRPRLWRGFALGAGVTLASVISGYLLLFVIGGASFDASAVGRLTPKLIGNVVVALLVVPVLVTTEEFIFRAIVYNYLRGGRKDDDTAVAAALLSAIIFAFAHGAQFGFHWLSEAHERLFIGLFLLGVLLSLTYEYSASLLPGLGIHVGLIWTEVIRAKTGIVVLDPSKWWMGGGGDPRTDPFIWLLFALLIAAICVWRRRLYAFAAMEPGKLEPGY